MIEQKLRSRRRKALKTIVIGGSLVAIGESLPDSWRRPVVNSVLLPAHAKTSGSEPVPPTPGRQIFNSATESAVFTVPDRVTSIHVVAFGASGGSVSGPAGTGGAGGKSVGDLPVTPGETLTVIVGGRGRGALNDGAGGIGIGRRTD